MKCPKCRFENRERAKFCIECGEKLEIDCPQCGKSFLPTAKYCDECGQRIDAVADAKKTAPGVEGERKHVTALFSDLSGYTAMSERLDPEEVKEISSLIFGKISQVIDKYGGFVEKYVGDAVMALFGVPKSQEDDPIRAIKSAREIHGLVSDLSPQYEPRIGHPLVMHTGINSGLVVTGEVDLEKGTHGLSGDTINLAARLSSLAEPGEIVVGPDTCRRAEGHFVFAALEPTRLKGKAEPVRSYKVISQKEIPITTHGLSGLSASLIGRKVEMTQLETAVQNLRQGKGTVFSICGDAGTGKSRLVAEFKTALNPDAIQWLEGHAYAYAQNIPYFPLIDLLNRVFQIEEGDSPEEVRGKIESGTKDLVGKETDVVPYVGGLFSLSYPEVEEVSPDFWKSRLNDGILAILSALARKSPTIFFLEDLHWADPSFLELLRKALIQIRQPAIVLCVYRPHFSLFTSHQLSNIGKGYREIRLQDLSSSEAQDMLESLLKTETVPSDLTQFIQDKAGGNPFYLEELANALIESGTLLRHNGGWRITKAISEAEISTTIHGVISSRLDRLESETKRILQEASVIGRAFLYDILRRVTEFEQVMDRCLRGLEQFDLIRTRTFQPDLEYMFKHALTQEVAYNGLLKKERQKIHERIGLVMERLFPDRLPEFYETLAFHFKQGESMDKAVEYLMKAGAKSLKKYSLEESHQHYKDAFDSLMDWGSGSGRDENVLIDLLIEWAFVFYYRGDFKSLTHLLIAHQDLGFSLDDKTRVGMFYAWHGFTLLCRGRVKDSYEYLLKGLEIGEQVGSQQVVGYACMWLTWTCSSFGLTDDAIHHGKRAQEIAGSFPSDHYLYFKTLGGLAHAYCSRGESKKAFEAGKALVAYGERYSNNRSLFMGHVLMGMSRLVAGDFQSASEFARKSVTVSVDPFYSMGGKVLLAMSYVFSDRLEEAEDTVEEILDFSRRFGSEVWGTTALMASGVITISKGRFREGLKILEEARQTFLKNGNRYNLSQSELILGKVYLQMVDGAKSFQLSTMAKNIGFLVKNGPFAGKNAEDHFNRAIALAKQIGAKGILGEAYLELGRLHRAKKRNKKAGDCITQAIRIFEQCEAEPFLKRGKEALLSLESSTGMACC